MSDKRKEEISAMMDNEASELELHRMLKSIEQDDELGESWSRYHLISGAMKGEIDSFSEFDISSRVSTALESEEAHSMPELEEPLAQASLGADEQSEIPASAPQAANDGSWLKKVWQPVAQAAVAASVAVAVVTGWQGVQVAGQSGTAEQSAQLLASQQVNAPSQLAASAPIALNGSGVQLASQENRNSIVRSGTYNNSGYSNGYNNIGSVYGNAAASTSGLTTVSTPAGVRTNNATVRTVTSSGTQLSEQHRRMLDSYFVTHTGNASINSSQGMMPFARVVNIEVE